jgi:hypothetical protein
MEELQATHVAEAQKVWDFLGHTEMALVPLDFSPICSGGPAQEMSQVLPTLDSAGAKILTLEEVIDDQLEAEGRDLAEKVAEHMLTYFRSWDPNTLLELVMQGAITEMEEVASSSVQDTTKIVAAWFQCQPKDSYGPTQLLYLLELPVYMFYINLLSIIVSCSSYPLRVLSSTKDRKKTSPILLAAICPFCIDYRSGHLIGVGKFFWGTPTT